MTNQSVQQTPRNIGLPIQRAVRQRCGFGCVICGLPLYEYEHMLGWATVQRHVPEEITLLCDKHHREKTSGLLPIEEVREANENPYNFRGGVSKPYDLHFSGNSCEVSIGSNTLTMEDRGDGIPLIPVSVDGIHLVRFHMADNHLLLTLQLFDEYNFLVLQIVDNRLIYSVNPWDIQLTGRNLIIREAERKILFDVLFEVPNKITIQRGRFLHNGVELLVTPEYVLLTNNHMMWQGVKAKNCQGGVVIGHQPQEFSAICRIHPVRRYFGDRKAAISWAQESFKNYESQHL